MGSLHNLVSLHPPLLSLDGEVASVNSRFIGIFSSATACMRYLITQIPEETFSRQGFGKLISLAEASAD